jgi:hypothetical protein
MSKGDAQVWYASTKAHRVDKEETTSIFDDIDYEGFIKFAKLQGYNLKRTIETSGITTELGIGPATFYYDNTEHAWRGWANRTQKTKE